MVEFHTFFKTLIGRPEGYPNNKDGKTLFFIAAKFKINIRTQDAAVVSQPVFEVCFLSLAYVTGQGICASLMRQK